MEAMQERSAVQELGARVAKLTALETLVKAERERARAEFDAMMLEAYERDGTKNAELRIGNYTVGNVIVTKPSARAPRKGSLGYESFAEWACRNRMGLEEIAIDTTDLNEDEREHILRAARECEAHAEVRHLADPRAIKSCQVVNGHVVTKETSQFAEGEIVPGAEVARPTVSVRDCRPQDVSIAMRLTGDVEDIAGFLGGGEDA